MYLSAANTLNFATNTTNRLNITSTGNVGINCTPTTSLTIRPINVSTNALSILDPAGTAQRIAQISFGINTNDGEISLDSNGTNNVRISSNRASYFNGGSVGIGIAAPATQVEIYNSSTLSGFRFSTATATESQMTLLANLGSGYDNAGYIKAAQESATNSYLAFGNKTSGTFSEKMRIASTGATTFSSSVNATAYNSSIGNDNIVFDTSGGTTGYLFMRIRNTSGSLIMGTEGATPGNVASGDLGYSSGIYTGTTRALHFGVDQTVAMTIVNGGNIGMGTTAPGYKLQLSTDSAAKPTSALWTIASDERIKENINPYKKGLQELLKINPITYDYNGLGGFAKGKGGVGIIAQEIIDILPDSVNSVKGKLNETDEHEIDILNFNGHELIYVLINAIKEQQAQIEELKGMIAAK